MIELETAIDKTKDQMKRIIAIMQEVSFSQQVIEQRVQRTQVIQEDSSAEYVGLLEEVKVETLQEAEFVAQQHCRASAGAQPANSCCEDCTKSHWRVPPRSQCEEAGCSHGCGYELTTCNLKGELQDPCHFPFKYGGSSHKACITESPFGKTKRPWCKTKKHKVVFCDCPVMKCSCPTGWKLKKDGQTCKGESLLETPKYSPLGLAQLSGGSLASSSHLQAKEEKKDHVLSLLQSMSSLLR